MKTMVCKLVIGIEICDEVGDLRCSDTKNQSIYEEMPLFSNGSVYSGSKKA